MGCCLPEITQKSVLNLVSFLKDSQKVDITVLLRTLGRAVQSRLKDKKADVTKARPVSETGQALKAFSRSHVKIDRP